MYRVRCYCLRPRQPSSQTKPSQSADWGGETCAKRKSTFPCLLAIATFDSITGLYNRHLNSNRGICLHQRFQRLVPRRPWTNYGRDKLRLVGCLGSEPGLTQSQTGGMRLLSGAYMNPPRLGEGSAGRARLCIVYPGICLTTEEKSRKTLCQVNLGIPQAFSYFYS